MHVVQFLKLFFGNFYITTTQERFIILDPNNATLWKENPFLIIWAQTCNHYLLLMIENQEERNYNDTKEHVGVFLEIYKKK
jgi:hypothetical protein